MGLLDTEDRTARLAAVLTARFELSHTVSVLNEAGILPMPLKGVLLQEMVYPDPADRLLSDADILVPTRTFPDALAALEAAGFARRTAIGRAGVSLRTPHDRLDIDLHSRLFFTGLYGLSAADVFDRGSIDKQTFGGTVVVPAPLDLYAHLIGNFAKGRHTAEDKKLIRDWSAVASRYGLHPSAIAEHLRRYGLGRAGRYALGIGTLAGDPHCETVLEALGTDRVGDLAARAARSLSRRYGSQSYRSLFAPHLVNSSLPRGLVSGVSHVAVGLRSRVSARLSPPEGRWVRGVGRTGQPQRDANGGS